MVGKKGMVGRHRTELVFLPTEVLKFYTDFEDSDKIYYYPRIQEKSRFENLRKKIQGY